MSLREISVPKKPNSAINHQKKLIWKRVQLAAALTLAAFTSLNWNHRAIAQVFGEESTITNHQNFNLISNEPEIKSVPAKLETASTSSVVQPVTKGEQVLSSQAQDLLLSQNSPSSQTNPNGRTVLAQLTPEEIERLQTDIQSLQDTQFRQIYLTAPSTSGGSPSGFGLNWRQGFVGFGFVARTRFTNSPDGGLSAGIGFGDAQKAVGLEVVPTISSLFGDDAFQAGGVDLKLHRILGPDLSVAVGVENLIQFGKQDTEASVYGVISKVFNLRTSTREPFSRLYTSVGLGGGRFRSESDIFRGRDTVNVFGAVGLRVIEPVAVFADWTGQDLNLGASLVPFREIPLVLTPSVQDVTGKAGDGPRFSLSLSYSFSF